MGFYREAGEGSEVGGYIQGFARVGQERQFYPVRFSISFGRLSVIVP
jgi:hypothetical protein